LQVVTVASVPESYEDRLREIFPGLFQRLRLFVLDPYDLVLSKWPGNVRELQNVLAQACMLAPGDAIDDEHILASIGREDSEAGSFVAARPAGVPLAKALQHVVEAAERHWIIEALAQAGTRKDAARDLGIDVRTLYQKIVAYEITLPDTQT
jgi:DNA-binding NtrC family response regulator